MASSQNYWIDPSGNIRRMEGEQEIIATFTDVCVNDERLAMYYGVEALRDAEGLESLAALRRVRALEETHGKE